MPLHEDGQLELHDDLEGSFGGVTVKALLVSISERISSGAMSTNLKWQEMNSDSSIADFAAKNNLSPYSLTKERKVLILPSNNNFTRLPEQHLFSAYAKEVLFVLKESGVDAAFYEDERPRRELVLKHATIFLPIVYFVGSAASGVILGVISNWIYDRFVKNNQKEPALIRYEDAELKPDGNIRFRRLEGPADQVSQILAKESKLLDAGKLEFVQGPQGSSEEANSKCKVQKKVARKKKSRKRKN